MKNLKCHIDSIVLLCDCHNVLWWTCPNVKENRP